MQKYGMPFDELSTEQKKAVGGFGRASSSGSNGKEADRTSASGVGKMDLQVIALQKAFVGGCPVCALIGVLFRGPR